MSEFTTRKITDRAGTGAPSFTYGLNSGGSDTGLIGKAYTVSGTEPSSPANGDTWYDSTNNKFYLYVNGEFKQITHVNPIPTWYGDRGLKMGGQETSGYTQTNIIEYWSMTSAGNASDFGDLTVARGGNDSDNGTGSGTYGMCVGGALSADPWYTNTIDKVVVSTTGNATDHGDLTAPRVSCATSNGAIGLIFGDNGNYNVNGLTIDQFSITTAGNATDFGDNEQKFRAGAACSDATRGVRMGGIWNFSNANVIAYVTYDTPSNATDFGDLTQVMANMTATSDTTRGIQGGGEGSSGRTNVIEYITIASTGNSTDFGDLTIARKHLASCSNATVAHFFGGEHYSGGFIFYNTIDQVTIQTTANATDFGDLVATTDGIGGTAGNAS
jgi:hypothetical protein